MTFIIMTLSIKGLFEILSINDTQHKGHFSIFIQHKGLKLSIVTLSIVTL
jgi:hypothetical protein